MGITKKELISKVRSAGYDKAGRFVSTPAEFIKEYYGGEDTLRRELDLAEKYSEEENQQNTSTKTPRKSYFKKENIKDRMFEEVPVFVRPSYGANYAYEDKEGNPISEVSTGGERASKIDLHNTEFKLDLLNKKNRTPEEESMLQKFLENTEYNEFEDFGDLVEMDGGKFPKDITKDSFLDKSIGSGIEHEMGHHVYQPSERKGYPVSTELKESYFDNKSELFQALGKFQREHFKEKGQRLTKPEDLYNLLKSDEEFDYLSKEGKRLINYLRKEEKGSKGDERIKFISELAPMFVSNDSDSFMNAVEQKLSS